MKPEAIRWRVLAVFATCVAFYAAFFAGTEHFRRHRGPWEVSFSPDASGRPMLQIAQQKLGIQNVNLVFVDGQLPAGFVSNRVSFDRPHQRLDLPYGTVRFLDTTFLPGTVTLEIFGHEVELLPRVLIVDKQEHRWKSGLTLALTHR